MKNKSTQNWMTNRRQGITHAWEVARQQGLTDFSVLARNKKCVTLQDGTFTEFVSCSYLGLETHPVLIEAAHEAMNRVGLHLSASRGAMHSVYLPSLETLLEEIYPNCGTIVFTSTSNVHLGILPLLGSDSLTHYPVRGRVHWLIDRTAHASMQVLWGILQQFGPVSRVQASNPQAMEDALVQCAKSGETPVLLVDGIGSMDGLIPINVLCEQMKQAGGYLYVDDAHGISICGRHGAGHAYEAVDHALPDNMIIAGSLSKAFGGAGGFVVLADRRDVSRIQALANPLVFGHSIMLPMLAANVAAARIHLDHEIELLQQQLWRNVDLLDVVTQGRLLNAGCRSPIRGAFFETEEQGLQAAAILREHAILAFPVFYPIIAKGKAMLRFAVSANHEESELRRLGIALEAVEQVKSRLK